ncbi:MAG: aminodeoxychorismate/anthranilate synthase component II [Deltaproteobacteria bacterium]|nr:aminodeoxychorismate/anthranilate synthase component II [Deltaproteobacteria bacterium]
MILLVDNYDSFTHNLFQALAGLGADVLVRRNDAITVDEVRALGPSHVILSPGPGRPDRARDFGVCGALIGDALQTGRPLLGVCLGHQGLAHALGGRVINAPVVMHGKVSKIRHDGTGVFAGLADGFEAMRYHSLAVAEDGLPEALRVTARTDDGVIMGLCHRERPLHGVQFHPESIGTPDGPRLLANFLEVS